MLLFILFRSSCSRSFSPFFFPSSCNFLSPSDVFARTRENHVKPRFKAVIYVNETLTTSTKFYSPELTLGPPRHTPRVSYSSYFFLCLYLVTSLDTKETKKKREKEEEEEEEQEERMARKLFFPTTERSLRNDRVLKLHSLMISPPYPNLFLWPLTKINSPPPPPVPFSLLFLRLFLQRGHSILAKHLTQGIISSLRGNAIPSPIYITLFAFPSTFHKSIPWKLVPRSITRAEFSLVSSFPFLLPLLSQEPRFLLSIFAV